MKLAVVIAAYDERENIENLTRRLDRALRWLPETDFELIFAVEGRDGTKEILESLASELGRIRVLYEERPTGLGNAFRRGFAAVSGDADVVVTMDADLNHQPEELPRLLEEFRRRDLDVLVGSRFIPGSRTEGIPFWKWSLSIAMNRLIGSLFDVEAKDKTSGYRIYRAEALRRLTGYRNNDFAFLPEMLIRAEDAGLNVAEAPIHFTFRTSGESKMSIAQTSKSYLALLRTRFDGWSLAALAFLLAGIAVRVLYAYPVHKFAADADSLLSALRAFDILEGDLRVFYSYMRIGALESYMHAAAFLLFGVSRQTVMLAPLLSGVLSLLAFFFFVRELLGRQIACFALLFFALASPTYMAWTYMPNGYPETLLFCVTTLWLAARIARHGAQAWSSLLLGLSIGLGWWNSFQTLTCAAPAVLWLFLRRKELLRKPRILLLAPAGFLIGAAPWIIYNTIYPLASFEQNFAARPAGSATEVLSNTRYFLGDQLAELTLETNTYRDRTNPFGGWRTYITPLQQALRLPAAAVYCLAAIALFAGPSLTRRRGERRERPRLLQKRSERPPGLAAFLLLWMTAATIFFLFVFSEAGRTRGLTVRYVLPLYIIVAAVLGVLIFLVAQRSRLLAGTLALIVVLFHAGGYYMPWIPQRKYLQEHAVLDQRLVEYLEATRIRWVCGNYWIVYPLTFLSEEEVLGIPFQSDHDHYGYARALPSGPARWALVDLDQEWLKTWVRRAGLEGRTVSVGPGYYVFLPSPKELLRPSRGALVLLRTEAPWGH